MTLKFLSRAMNISVRAHSKCNSCGLTNFVFSMYGAPGEVDKLRQLVGVMREQHLGNGFDPGSSPQTGAKPVFDYLATIRWPVMCYPGGDMQVEGGRSALGPANEASLSAMDQAAYSPGAAWRVGLLFPQSLDCGILVARQLRQGL